MIAGEKMREIVGVVGNVKHLSLKNEDSPEMYLPRTQIPIHIMSIVVRANVSNPAGANECVAQRTGRDGRAPFRCASVRVFDEYISRSLARPRFNALVAFDFRRDRARSDCDRHLRRDGLLRGAADE